MHIELIFKLHLQSLIPVPLTCLPVPSPFNAHHHCLSMRAQLLQSCPKLCNPMDCSKPESSVHKILQARILEWAAVPHFPIWDLLDPGIEPTSLCLLHWQTGSSPLVKD